MDKKMEKILGMMLSKNDELTKKEELMRKSDEHVMELLQESFFILPGDKVRLSLKNPIINEYGEPQYYLDGLLLNVNPYMVLSGTDEPDEVKALFGDDDEFNDSSIFSIKDENISGTQQLERDVPMRFIMSKIRREQIEAEQHIAHYVSKRNNILLPPDMAEEIMENMENEEDEKIDKRMFG